MPIVAAARGVSFSGIEPATQELSSPMPSPWGTVIPAATAAAAADGLDRVAGMIKKAVYRRRYWTFPAPANPGPPLAPRSDFDEGRAPLCRRAAAWRRGREAPCECAAACAPWQRGRRRSSREHGTVTRKPPRAPKGDLAMQLG